MGVVYFAGSTYLRTTAGRTVCLRGCCSTSYRKMSASPNTSENWRTEDFVASDEYRELYDIAGEPVCVEVEKIAGHKTMQLLQVVQTTMNDASKVHPRDFKGRIILMSM